MRTIILKKLIVVTLYMTLASVTPQPLSAHAIGEMEISNIRNFGASETATDNWEHIQRAVDSNRPVYIPYGTFDFNTPVTNPHLTPMFGPGTLNFTGAGSHAIVLGAADGLAHMAPTSQMTVLRVTRDSFNFSDASAGVALINVYDLTARLWVEGFETGVLLEGNAAGCAYNTLHLGRLKQNRVGLRLHSHKMGYVNQNTFIAGRFGGLGNSCSGIPMGHFQQGDSL